MFQFTFDTSVENKKELRDEIAHLLWQIDFLWPSYLSNKQIDWIKEKADQSFLKLNGGHMRHAIKVVDNKTFAQQLKGD